MRTWKSRVSEFMIAEFKEKDSKNKSKIWHQILKLFNWNIFGKHLLLLYFKTLLILQEKTLEFVNFFVRSLCFLKKIEMLNWACLECKKYILQIHCKM